MVDDKRIAKINEVKDEYYRSRDRHYYDMSILLRNKPNPEMDGKFIEFLVKAADDLILEVALLKNERDAFAMECERLKEIAPKTQNHEDPSYGYNYYSTGYGV